MTKMNVTSTTGESGLPKLVLETSDGARAEVYLQGAQVTSWTPAGEREDRLFLSKRSAFRAGTAIRGGVPISFPQFANQGSLPNHGFARTTEWMLVSAGQSDHGGARAKFRLLDSDATRELWPHRFELEFDVALSGPRLVLSLSVMNCDTTPFEFTAALHTYLRVGSTAETAVHGLSGAHYRDKVLALDDVVETAQTLRLDRPLDRVYRACPQNLEVVEPARRLAALGHRFPDTVVWNPGAEAASKMSDMESSGEAHFVCVEAAASSKPIRVANGDRWVGEQMLECR